MEANTMTCPPILTGDQAQADSSWWVDNGGHGAALREFGFFFSGQLSAAIQRLIRAQKYDVNAVFSLIP